MHGTGTEAAADAIEVVVSDGRGVRTVVVAADGLFRDPDAFVEDARTLVRTAAPVRTDTSSDLGDSAPAAARILSWRRPASSGSRYEVALIRKDDPYLRHVLRVVVARGALEACAAAAWDEAATTSSDPLDAFASVVASHAFFPEHVPMSMEDLEASARMLAEAVPDAARLVALVDAPHADDVLFGAETGPHPDAPAGSLAIVRFETSHPRVAGANLSIVHRGRRKDETLGDWLHDVARTFADRFVPENAPERASTMASIVARLRPRSVSSVGPRRVFGIRMSFRHADGLIRSVLFDRYGTDMEDVATGMSIFGALRESPALAGPEFFAAASGYGDYMALAAETVSNVPDRMLAERLAKAAAEALEDPSVPRRVRKAAADLVDVLTRRPEPLPADRTRLDEANVSILLPPSVDLTDDEMIDFRTAAKFLAHTRCVPDLPEMVRPDASSAASATPQDTAEPPRRGRRRRT